MEFLLMIRNAYLLKGLLSFALLFVLIDEFKREFMLADVLLVGCCISTMAFYCLFKAWRCERLIQIKEERIKIRQKKLEVLKAKEEADALEQLEREQRLSSSVRRVA